MRVFNSDGSEAEMSGNGIRLFAKFVLDRGIAKPGAEGLRVETGGGLRVVVPTFVEGRMISAQVAMGTPTFVPAEIPVDAAALGGAQRVFDFPLEVAGRSLPITCLGLGNPHAVAILDEPVDEFPLAQVGPAVMNHPMFPNRINFEIVNVLSRTQLRARIFERGEGETLSSGTGSTAVSVAARAHGLTDDSVEIQLRGGVLRVSWAGQGEALLEGPAVEVFTGVWPDPGAGAK
jgi:diaminopimelate epimerase